jgi:hypothetical protein
MDYSECLIEIAIQKKRAQLALLSQSWDEANKCLDAIIDSANRAKIYIENRVNTK